MEKFTQSVRAHKFAVLIAVMISIVVSLPQVYFRIDHKSDGVYQGIELLPDSPWSTRVREVQDGHPGLGSIYYKDGKNDPYLFQPFGTIVWGFLGKLFSLDINNTFLLARGLFTFITSLLIYAFVYLLGRNRYAALCSMVVILLADSVLSYGGVMKLLHGIPGEEFLSIGKPVNNTMIYIPFFGFLLSFFLFYRNRLWRYGILSAVLLGINFYNYFYTWTYLYAFGGILGLTFLIQKKYKDAWHIATVFIGGIVVAIPYLLNLYNSTLHPAYEDVHVRFGIVLSHSPEFIGFVSLGALLLFTLLYPRTDKETYYFGLALLLAPIITLNQQVLTGILMQEGHYHWYFHKPLAVICVLIIVFYLLSKSALRSYATLLVLMIVTVSIGIGLFIQIKSYHHGITDGGEVLIERQKYGPVMKWLTENTQKEEVVFANDEISHLTVIYTPLNVFYHRSGYASLAATHERLLDSILTFYRLRGVTTDEAESLFYKERVYFSANLYGVYYRDLLGSDAAIPDEKIKEFIVRYAEISKMPTDEWLRFMWSKYEVAYVVWDMSTEPSWHLEQYTFLKESARYGDLVIYETTF